MSTVVPWWRRSIERVMEFIQAVLAAPGTRVRMRRAGQARALLPGPEGTCAPGTAAPGVELGPEQQGLLLPAPAEDLPCDLLLTNGHGAIPLFTAGPVDELSFFQRTHVPSHLEVEFLTRLDREDAGTEAFKPYGMFRLRPQDGQTLPDPKDLPEAFWAALYREHGLVKLLPAARVLASGYSAWDPKDGSPERGRNRVRAANPGFNWKRVRGKRYTHADLLELLRRHLPGPERIAWIEAAIPDAIAPGEILHRYYLDTGRRLWLVRHHWSRGKSLHKAVTTEEAKRLLVISGALPRRLAA